MTMTRDKNKVIVWRPFPSPTKRDSAVVPAVLKSREINREEVEREQDQAAVNRWIELADILNGNAKPKSKAKKRGAA